MSAFKEVIQRIRKDPRVIADRLYYSIRGIRVIELKNRSQDDSGTLAALSRLAVREDGDLEKKNLSEIVENDDRDSEELGELFKQYGSDKSTKHDYYRLYASLLKTKRNESIKILEIGLGTNNTDFQSNMGKYGKPGASLRAFRDWAPHSFVYGADIDEGCLFSEERIETFFVDQTRPETLDELSTHFEPYSFDLIIDDGLHTAEANVNTLERLLRLVKPDGALVIEDILERYIPTWKIAASLLKSSYEVQLIQARKEAMFLVRKKVAQ
jgi:SAM-dependent methyltransferase